MEWDKAPVELEMMLKKASQEIAASSGTSEKPAHKEHAPPPKPSKVSKWIMFPLVASMYDIHRSTLLTSHYTAPLTTHTIGFMFMCIFWAIGNLTILIHRLWEGGSKI